MMNQRERDALDRYITGNYGEDQFPNHTCTKEECGHTCWLEDDVPTRSISVYYGDAGTVDGEGPCDCEEHE